MLSESVHMKKAGGHNSRKVVMVIKVVRFLSLNKNNANLMRIYVYMYVGIDRYLSRR